MSDPLQYSNTTYLIESTNFPREGNGIRKRRGSVWKEEREECGEGEERRECREGEKRRNGREGEERRECRQRRRGVGREGRGDGRVKGEER